MKCKWASVKYGTILTCFKFRKRTTISILEYKALKVKGKFGKDYLDLVGDSAPVYDLQDCLGINLKEFFELQQKIKANFEQIKEKELQTQRKIRAARGTVEEDENDVNDEEEDPDAAQKQVRFKMPSKSVMSSNPTVGDSKISKRNDNADANYDSDGGNTADITLSDRPLRTLLKRPGERKYDSDSGNSADASNSERPKRKRKKGKRPRKVNSSPSNYSDSGDIREFSPNKRPIRRRKQRFGQQRNYNADTRNSSRSNRVGNARIVTTTTTSATPKRKPKRSPVKRNGDGSDRSTRSNVKVVTTTTRPKRKKVPPTQ